LLSFSDSPTCAYMESIAGCSLVDDPRAVGECQRRYDHLRAVAPAPELSLRLIDSMREGLA
jgi:hypothetical protein